MYSNQRQLKNYLVYALMSAICAGSIWLIFVPSKDESPKPEAQTGFNATIPDPQGAGIVGDKKTAYEQELLERERNAHRQTLGDYASAFGYGADMSEERFAQQITHEAAALPPQSGGYGTAEQSGSARRGASSRAAAGKNRRAGPAAASEAAVRRIGRTLDSFYDPPAEEGGSEELRRRIVKLEAQLAEQAFAPPTMEEQIALMEKSYELAAKYREADAGGPQRGAEGRESCSGEKPRSVPVGRNERSVVSSLVRNDGEKLLTGPARRDFVTPVGKEPPAARNTVRACIHADQSVLDGQSVRLRLLEEIRVGSLRLPRNTLVTGTARIGGERLAIDIASLHYEGTVLTVELTVCDNDGQPGLFIPRSLGRDAAKEAAAGMGQNLGTTVSFSNRSAGGQLLEELGKGAIQGTSQYIARKLRQTRIHLKADYEVMLCKKPR